MHAATRTAYVLGRGGYCVYVLPARPPQRPRIRICRADFSRGFRSCPDDRARARGHRMWAPVSHESAAREAQRAEETVLCGSCESRARFVDARLTSAARSARTDARRSLTVRMCIQSRSGSNTDHLSGFLISFQSISRLLCVTR